MRDNFTQIPSSEELRQILSREAKRVVPGERKDVRFADFAAAVRLSEAVGADPDIFTREFTIEDLDDPALLDAASALIQTITKNISQVPQEVLDATYDYLAEEDALSPADYIFVFGSKTHLRMQKAVELWKAGIAPKICISGNKPNYSAAEESEAEAHRKYALEHGVPGDALVLESEAITLPDNVKRSLNMLEGMGVTQAKVILVNSPYSQRRGWCHFMKFSGMGYEFVRVNSLTKPELAREGWYTNEEGIKVVLNEFIKLKVAEILNSV